MPSNFRSFTYTADPLTQNLCNKFLYCILVKKCMAHTQNGLCCVKNAIIFRCKQSP